MSSASEHNEVELSGVVQATAFLNEGPLTLIADEADIVSLELSDRDFRISEFGNTTFESVNLGRTKLAESRFRGCVFRGCDLSAVDFSGSFFKDVLFASCKLSFANFFDATLDTVAFDGGVMRDAELAGMSCNAVEMRSVDLTGSHFARITLKQDRDLDLTGSVLDQTNGISTIRGVVIDTQQAALVAQSLLDQHGIIVADNDSG